jgi:DNA-binding CsgD family transcriptional regulator
MLLIHIVTLLYILSLLFGVVCLAILIGFKAEILRSFSVNYSMLRKFLLTFFCFFSINFLIYYNEFFMSYSILKAFLLVAFDTLLVLSIFFCIKIHDSPDKAILRVFSSVGVVYIVMWLITYFFDLSCYPPLEPIIKLIADALFSSVTAGILVINISYQIRYNPDSWEKKYLITLDAILGAYICLLYCADLFTELSHAYISAEVPYPYLYDPLLIAFIIVNLYTTIHLTFGIKKIYSAGISDRKMRTVSINHQFYNGINISVREQEVVVLMIKGLNNFEIADILNISVYTVKRHINSIYKKFSVKNRFELICKIKGC